MCSGGTVATPMVAIKKSTSKFQDYLDNNTNSEIPGNLLNTFQFTNTAGPVGRKIEDLSVLAEEKIFGKATTKDIFGRQSKDDAGRTVYTEPTPEPTPADVGEIAKNRKRKSRRSTILTSSDDTTGYGLGSGSGSKKQLGT